MMIATKRIPILLAVEKFAHPPKKIFHIRLRKSAVLKVCCDDWVILLIAYLFLISSYLNRPPLLGGIILDRHERRFLFFVCKFRFAKFANAFASHTFPLLYLRKSIQSFVLIP